MWLTSVAWVLFPSNSDTLENMGQRLELSTLHRVFGKASPRGCHLKLDLRNEGEDLKGGGRELGGTDGKSQGQKVNERWGEAKVR